MPGPHLCCELSICPIFYSRPNWVQTIPGKGWFMILRLYGPLEPWFDKSWRPGEVELQK
ncbi:MAG: hypothetical protein WCA83_02825 [Azonexus sp.]